MRLYDDSAVCRVRKHLLKNIGALQAQLSNTEFTCHDMNICRSWVTSTHKILSLDNVRPILWYDLNFKR
jgi:hypothetical protein